MLRSFLSQLLAGSKADAAQPERPAPTDAALAQARERLAARDLEGAATAAAQILSGDPQNAAALMVSAEALRRQGKTEAAMEVYRRVLVLDPQRAEAWLDLGVCHYVQGDTFWARVYFRVASTLQPDNADIWNELALVEIILGNLEKAEESLEQAVNRNPEHPEAWNNLGLVVARRRDLATARRHFLRATFLRPDYYMALCNLGLVCRDLEMPEEAAKTLEAATRLAPEKPLAWLNLGMALQDLGRFGDALQALERAAAAAPADPDVAAALSALWLRRGDAQQAIASAERGLQCAPDNPEARLALAHGQLALKRFAEGWSNYEARLASSASPVARLPFPLWRGEPLQGKTLLVQREQGLGDQIMFASCLPELLAEGGRCVLNCDKRLVPLFRRSFDAAAVVGSLDELDASSGSGGGIDYCLPIGSLPRRYRGSEAGFAGARPYLRASEEKIARWRAPLAALGPGLKVGVAWRGGLYRTGRTQRSLSLEHLLPVLRTEGVRWVGLQHDASDDELRRFREQHGIDIASWKDALADLDETAALAAGLDLVIAVCSTVVHLAGALGRPVWTLTPRAPAWRYFADGATMPWYPEVRLFRQKSDSGWQQVIGELADELRDRCLS